MLKSLKKSGGLIASLVVTAAVLPIVLVATLSEDLRLRSYANQVPQMRVWTEPRNVVAAPGKSFSLKLYAEATPDDRVVPQVKFDFLIPEGVEADPAGMEYTRQFSGKVFLGEIQVKTVRSGEFVLGIAEGSVNTRLPNLQVTTQGTGIISRK